jgi:hypothetical protein
MSVLMTDEPVDTNCPLCGEDLGVEQFFHMRCAEEESARDDMMPCAEAEDRLTYDRRV